jgi:hypothetical protein
MTDFVIPKKQYVLMDEGTYLAEITELEQDKGDFGPQVKFTFTLLDVNEEDAQLIGWCSATYSPNPNCSLGRRGH